MQTRQWIGTYAGRGNGDYQGELCSRTSSHHDLFGTLRSHSNGSLVRLDGQYGDAVAIAQLIEAGVYLVTRARGYRVLEHRSVPTRARPPTNRQGNQSEQQ
jgi:hypothetical protein